MQVVFTSDVTQGGFRFEAGNGYDLDKAAADRFIAQGVAVPTDQTRQAGIGVPIASADLATAAGAFGALYELADGPNAGAKLTWAIPAGESTPTWCWWLWPQSAYTA